MVSESTNPEKKKRVIQNEELEQHKGKDVKVPTDEEDKLSNRPDSLKLES